MITDIAHLVARGCHVLTIRSLAISPVENAVFDNIQANFADIRHWHTSQKRYVGRRMNHRKRRMDRLSGIVMVANFYIG